MLYHHSHQSYEVAASEAAREARAKMEALWKPGQAEAQRVLEQVQTEVPADYVVPSHKLDFEQDASAAHGLRVSFQDRGFGLVKNSFAQICTNVGLPVAYASDLARAVEVKEPGKAANEAALVQRREWACELLAFNLRQLYEHAPKKKFLVRAVKDDVRGVLSDKYRRLDCRPLVDAFAKACGTIGAQVVGGTATETKVELKAMLPLIFEPVPNEVMCFGVSWSNSDFGNGAHSLRAFVLRLWCTNKAIADELLRQVHVGRRLDDNVEFSARTYQLDTATTASALGDLVGRALNADTVHSYLDKVRAANDRKVEPRTVGRRLSAMNLSKDEQRSIKEAFESNDVEMLPAGNTEWRFSNAISWFSGHRASDPERRLELEAMAGKVVVDKGARASDDA